MGLGNLLSWHGKVSPNWLMEDGRDIFLSVVGPGEVSIFLEATPSETRAT